MICFQRNPGLAIFDSTAVPLLDPARSRVSHTTGERRSNYTTQEYNRQVDRNGQASYDSCGNERRRHDQVQALQSEELHCPGIVVHFLATGCPVRDQRRPPEKPYAKELADSTVFGSHACPSVAPARQPRTRQKNPLGNSGNERGKGQAIVFTPDACAPTLARKWAEAEKPSTASRHSRCPAIARNRREHRVRSSVIGRILPARSKGDCPKAPLCGLARLPPKTEKPVGRRHVPAVHPSLAKDLGP